MTMQKTRSKSPATLNELKSRHILLVQNLVETVDQWAKELDWSTRKLDRTMRDEDFGEFQVRGLLMQKEFSRALLDPRGRSDAGFDAVVEIYLMPAYDDIARLVSENGEWKFRYISSKPPTSPALKTKARKKWSRKSFAALLEEITRHET